MKAVTKEQLLESARQGEALTMQVAQAAQAELAGKQEKLSGTQGQVVGFDASGTPVAQSTDSLRGPKGEPGATGPKGATGAAGPAGAAAGFGTPTATVDANTGTPSVTITTSGPDTAKVFNFVFKNLKGATGAQGPKGETGATGAQGPKGATGARGATGPQGPAGPGLPAGGIIIWSGAANAIPTGWALCNGSNGTPDLRDRFVLGAGNKYAVGAKGGSETVTLSELQIPSHTHDQDYATAYSQALSPDTNTAGKAIDYRSDGAVGFYMTDGNYIVGTTQANHYQATQAHNNMPPYYALCYIMKL